MKITKLGHSCLLVEEKGVNILLDPGVFSSDYQQLQNVDVLLITHEHSDHFDLNGVKKLIANSPNLKIFTNHGYFHSSVQ
jgi:L-ascorbate metabolism protein UlaG (beta-lactamase superfamily)